MACLHHSPKADFPNVWQSGVVRTTLPEIDAAFGQSTDKRRQLMASLTRWANYLEKSGLKARMWVCGSFMTAKPEPKDIDVILWPAGQVYAAHDIATVAAILDPKIARAHYMLDVHVESLSNEVAFDREATHLGFYGFGWDRRTPRTIAEIELK